LTISARSNLPDVSTGWSNDKGIPSRINPPVIQEERLSALLLHLDYHKSIEPDGIHLSELMDVLTKPLSIIYQQSWPIMDVPDYWRLVSVMPICKKS